MKNCLLILFLILSTLACSTFRTPGTPAPSPSGEYYTPTDRPTLTPFRTATFTPTNTPTLEPSLTPLPTETPTVTDTPTLTPEPTARPTRTPTEEGS